MLTGLVAALVLMAPSVMASDISGRWHGSAELKTPDSDPATILVHADFKHHGKALTGTIGKEDVGQWPIDKGKVEDGQVTPNSRRRKVTNRASTPCDSRW
jgi:hypothetical protein